MTITIESKDGVSRNVIDVDAYGPVGTSLFSLRTVLELVTRGIMDANRYEEKAAASDLRQCPIHASNGPANCDFCTKIQEMKQEVRA